MLDGSYHRMATARRARLVLAIATRPPNWSISGSLRNWGAPPDSVIAVAMLTAPIALARSIAPKAATQSCGPGRPANGNIVLSEFSVKAAPTAKLAEAKPIGLHKPMATFAQDGFPIANAIDNNPGTGWALSPQLGKSHSALFEVKEVIKNEAGTTFTVTMSMQFGQQHTIGKFRLSATNDKQPRLADGVPENVRKLLAIPADKRSPALSAELIALHRNQDGEYRRLQAAVGLSPVPDKRTTGAQDVAWALINSPAFLFNH